MRPHWPEQSSMNQKNSTAQQFAPLYQVIFPEEPFHFTSDCTFIFNKLILYIDYNLRVSAGNILLQ